MSWLALVGFASTLGQVILLREASVSFYGVELVYLLAIGAWLLATALGVASDRRDASVPSAAAVSALLAVSALVVVADVALLRASRVLLGGMRGAFLPFERQLLALGCALLPAGVLLGLLFQWAARRAVARGYTLSSAYAVESAGALAGGLTAMCASRMGIQTFTLAALLGVAGAAVALASAGRIRSRLAWAVLVAVALAVLLRSAALDAAMTRWNHPYLLDSRDSPYGRVTLTRSAGQVSVFENDALAFETGGTDAEALAHVAALHHPGPVSVLVLGGGPEGVAREVLQHRPARVTVVELNPVLVTLTGRHLGEMVPARAQGASVRLVVEDPRRYLRQQGEKADLIVMSAPEPDSGEANRFYTREFFSMSAARLAAGGVIAFRLRLPENYLTPAQAGRARSICRAVASSFSHVLILPGPTSFVLASNAPLPSDPDVAIARLGERGIRARLVSPAFLRYLYTNDRRPQLGRLLFSGETPENTDARPVCYRYALVVWVGRFWPALASFDLPAAVPADGPLWAGLVAALAAGGLLAARRRLLVRRMLLVGTAGVAGMLLDTTLLLHYQVKHGVVFQDVGTLVAAFMAGLATGALATERIVRRSHEAAGRLALGGAAAVAALALVGWLVGLMVSAGAAPRVAGTSGLVALTASLVGGVFAWASLAGIEDQRGVIAPLYAADLMGGCLGALLGGLVLVPVVGLAWSAFVAALIAVMALALA